jgi:hypothetical protein
MARKLKNKPTVTPPIDTGIYRIPGDRWAGVETHTPEALATVAESIAASWKPRSIDSELKRILGNARIGKADPREHVRKAANDLLTSVFWLHKAIAEGNLRAVAYYGVEVGTNDEQLLIKLAHEENAMRGKRSKKRGHDRVEQIARARRERRAEIKAEVEERRRRRGRHKTPSDTQIYSETAAQFGVSIPTVRRADGKK